MSPPNVLVTKFGEVKIVDFGLAKATSQLEKSEPGIVKGKFAYLSPEATLGLEVDSRADIFAVGIMLWELLASQRLFLGDTDLATVKKVEVAQVPSISKINRKVPPELERIVNKALARDPAQRYRTAREFGEALSRFMFSFAQPVSSYDIATIVQGAMREKQQAHAPQGSLIDQLIEEALFEFTSLKEDGGPASGIMKAADAPLNAEAFLDPANFANKGAIGERTPSDDPVRASLPLAFEQDNLSVLEDTGSMPAARRVLSSVSGRNPMAPTTPSGRLAPLLPMDSGQRPPAKTSRTGAVIAIVVFLVLAAAASTAWFTGIIPHH
jgi:serine/threonine-protein kinase